jgi:exoribonuclease R
MGGRTGRRFSPGTTVRVTVDRVDRYKRQVDFRLADEGSLRRQPAADRRKGR